jgi:multicomponent Na+:H+ antiporter subunit C
MHWVSALVIGVLVTTGVYLVLRRSLVKLLFGFVLLSHAANLTVFTLGGLTRGRAPLVPAGSKVPDPGHADPLPQALVLTAIVIGFAVVAFLSVLIHRTIEETGTGDVEEMRETES